VKRLFADMHEFQMGVGLLASVELQILSGNTEPIASWRSLDWVMGLHQMRLDMGEEEPSPNPA
jgi:hypothetical protein